MIKPITKMFKISVATIESNFNITDISPSTSKNVTVKPTIQLPAKTNHIKIHVQGSLLKYGIDTLLQYVRHNNYQMSTPN